MALISDQLIIALLPPRDSNTSSLVLMAQLVELACSPYSSKLQDQEHVELACCPHSPKLQDQVQEVSSLVKDIKGNVHSEQEDSFAFEFGDGHNLSVAAVVVAVVFLWLDELLVSVEADVVRDSEHKLFVLPPLHPQSLPSYRRNQSPVLVNQFLRHLQGELPTSLPDAPKVSSLNSSSVSSSRSPNPS